MDRMNPLMELPNYGFGPVSPLSRSGIMPRGEVRATQGPISENALLNALLTYGPMPAQAVAGEFDSASNALARSIDDPSIANLGETAVRTLMLGGAPVKAAGATGVAYGAAALKDAFAPTSATAADPAEIERRLRSMPPSQVRDLQRALGVPEDGRVGGQTINALYQRESEKERKDAADREQATEIARIEAEARGKSEAQRERIRAETEARSSLQRDSADRISGAKRQLITDLTAARTPNKDTSAVGQLYEQLGVLTPLAAGVAGGMGYRMAKPALATGYKFVDDYLNPALAGAEIGGSVALAPTYSQAYRGDPTNPEYRAWQNYELALPADATDERSRVPRNIPQIDPAVAKARDSLNDTVFRGQAMLQGGLGGVFGNIAGAAVGQAPKIAGDLAEGAARMPNRLYRAATTPPQFTDDEMQAIIGAKQRDALIGANLPKVTIPPPNLPQGGGPVAPGGGGAPPVAGPVAGQQVQPPNPPPARARNPNRAVALDQAGKDSVLQKLASGNASNFSPAEQAYADYLTRLSTDLGVDAGRLLSSRSLRRTPWAVPLTAGAASFEDALGQYRQLVIDMDGDGIPDATIGGTP